MLFSSPKNVLLLSLVVAFFDQFGVVPVPQLQSLAHAGGGSTAGGFGVETPLQDDGSVLQGPSPQLRVVTYDYYEALNMAADRTSLKSRLQDYDFGRDYYDWPQRVQVAIDRLKPVNPGRAYRYTAILTEILNRREVIRFERGTKLSFASDIGMASTCDSDTRCPGIDQLVQIAKQSKPNLNRPYRYLIDKDLWDRMDEVQKAILILHEIIYRDNLSGNSSDHQTSEFTRFFNMSLWKKTAKTWTLGEYARVAVAASLGSIEDAFQNAIAIPSSETALPLYDEFGSLMGYEQTIATPVRLIFSRDRKALHGATLILDSADYVHLGEKDIPYVAMESVPPVLAELAKNKKLRLGVVPATMGSVFSPYGSREWLPHVTYNSETGKIRNLTVCSTESRYNGVNPNNSDYKIGYFNSLLPNGLQVSVAKTKLTQVLGVINVVDSSIEGVIVIDLKPRNSNLLMAEIADANFNTVAKCDQPGESGLVQIDLKTGKTQCLTVTADEYLASFR